MRDNIALPPVIRHRCRTGVDDLRDEHRHINERGREDDRDNAGLVDLERQVGGGTTVLATADHALGVLHRNAALALLDEGDAHNEDDEADGNHREDETTVVLEDVNAIGRQAGRDTREDEQRHTVANALLRDELAHPHDEHGARGHGDNEQDERKDVAVRGKDLNALAQQLLAVSERHDA